MPPLPYENSTAGERALDDIRKLLRGFGCNSFGSMQDWGSCELIVQFEWRGRRVTLKASWRGYAAAWLREHPWTTRMKRTKMQHEQHALDVGSVAVYSILRDWMKGQIVAVETGLLSFEGAFLGHLMLPDGRRVLDVAEKQGMLPGPREEDDGR